MTTNSVKTIGTPDATTTVKGKLEIATQAEVDARVDALRAVVPATLPDYVTGGDGHDHTGGNGAQIGHATLSSIGTNTHDQIDTHISDDTKHRLINDGAASSTDLWSASKISTEIASASGTTNHSEFNELDYASSGHTGFQPTGNYLTDSEFTTYSGTLQTQIDGKSDTDHLHDDRYYTESEVDSLITTATGSLSIALDDLSDVTLIPLIDYQVLSYEAFTGWSNPSFSSLGDLYFTRFNHDHTGGNGAQINHTTLSGIGTSTHAQIDTHISDDTKHRLINDSGGSSTELWSASKINTEITNVSGSLQTSIDGKSDTGHLHDDRYYTETEVDDLITTATGSLTVNHSELNELDYVSSGHTGFQPSGDYATITELTTASGDIVSQIPAEYTNEMAQDAVGNITSGEGSVTVTYSDINNTLTISGTEEVTEITKYVTTVAAWTTSSGGIYYADVTHGLKTKDIIVDAYTTADNLTVGLEDIDRTDTNTIRIWSATNTQDVRVVVLSTNTGEAPGAHTVQSHSDTSATGAQLNLLVGGGDIGLHTHSGTGYAHNSLTGVTTDQHHAQSHDNTDHSTNYLANVVEDTTPQLGGNLDLNQKYIQLDPTPSSDLTGNGDMVPATVDTNSVGIGSALYMASDGNFDEADADTVATMPCRAIALETGTGTKEVLLKGYIRKDAWDWTPGLDIFISTTVGTFVQTAPAGTGDQVQKVGFAWSSDVIYFSPGDYTVIEVT